MAFKRNRKATNPIFGKKMYVDVQESFTELQKANKKALWILSKRGY